MSAALTPPISWPSVHRQFEAVLPQLDNTIRFHFRHWPRRRRAEAIADARSVCWLAWYGLVLRGQDPLAVGPTGIAYNACRYVKAGRQFGTGTCGRAALDVYHPRVQRRLGFRLISLDRETSEDARQAREPWCELLAADNRCNPADEAAFRLDFTAWLEALPPRKRRVAGLLAEGHGTGIVATLLGVTPGAVSQTRAWLHRSWRQFQGAVGAAPLTAPWAIGPPRREPLPLHPMRPETQSLIEVISDGCATEVQRGLARGRPNSGRRLRRPGAVLDRLLGDTSHRHRRRPPRRHHPPWRSRPLAPRQPFLARDGLPPGEGDDLLPPSRYPGPDRPLSAGTTRPTT
jgi:hypothetical protein